MNKFIKYIIIVIFSVLLLDLFNRVIVDALFNNIPADSELSRSYPFHYLDQNASVLILGSSRGVYSYDTDLLRDSLHTSCYSASYEATSIINHYLTLLRVCKDDIKPDIILLDVSSIQFQESWVKGRISSLYPFYWSDPQVKKVVDDVQGRAKSSLLISSLFQYNSIYYSLLVDGYIKKRHDHYGYIPIEYTGKPFEFDEDESEDNEVVLQLDPKGEEYLDKFVLLCKQEGINLILCDSPRLNNAQQWDDYLDKYSKNKNVEFWNYSTFPKVVNDKRLFVDKLHLNEKGARIFTEELIKKLKGKRYK